MKAFFKFAGNFLRSLPKLLLFELMFKLVLSALGVPLLSFLLRAAMSFAKVSYLSAESLPQFLTSPFTAVLLILILFVIAFFSIVELCALISCCACFHEGQKITVSGMLKAGLGAFSRAFRGKGIISFFGFMLIIPLVQFTLSSGIFLVPAAPILRSLMGTPWQYLCIAAYILLELFIFYILAGRCYSLHYLVLTKSHFSECTGKSLKCLEGKKLYTAVTLALWSFLLLIAAAAVTLAVSFAIIFCIRGFSRPDAAFSSALKVLSYAGQIAYAVSAVISAPFIISCLTTRFFIDTRQEEQIVLPDTTVKKYPRYVKTGAVAVAAAVSIFLNFSYLEALYKGNIGLSSGLFSGTQITAHRGFSHVAPENTVYAFEEAINIGADYIELDVQQSKDGQLVVFHDSKLDRTSDGVGTLSDFTYDELLRLSCGSWFKGGERDFSDAKIMLLSEVLELAGDDILLNIEIKKQGEPEDTARKTAELLMEYDMTDSCYVTSFSYSALKAVKKTEPRIKTALISNAAAPTVYSQLKYIDAVSLNYVFVNQNVVSAAHKNGKRVFVWTVNDSEDMKRMISLGADNIITDRPDIAAETVYSYGKGDFVISLLKRIFGT